VRVALLLGLFAFFAAHSLVRADELSSAREHYRKATKAFELGAFDEAIREYTEAYRIKDDPAILYNLGQAHRLAEHPGEALHFYKMYLTKVPDSPIRAEVESKIDILQKLVDQQRKAPSPAPEPVRQVAPPSPPPAVVEKPAPKPREPAPPGRAKKIAGIAVGALGVGALATGIAFGVLAKNAGDDLTRLTNMMGTFDYDKQQTGLRDQVVAGVLLGVGGAALATGVVLYVLGQRDARAARRHSAVSIMPTIAHGFAGAQLQSAF
jgi:tetratricopeptide (TPR) repeat protein